MAYVAAYLAGPMQFGGKQSAQWWDLETTDTVATAVGAGYISDALARGMKLGDMVRVTKRASLPAGAVNSMSWHYVTTVSGSTFTLSAAVGDTSGLTVNVGSGAASPDAALDTADGYAIGSLYIETDVDKAYICYDNTATAAVWKPATNTYVLSFPGLSVLSSGAAVARFIAPTKFAILSAYSVANHQLTTGPATITLAIAGTGVTGGVITIAHGGAVGDMDTAAPSALNTGAAGALITATVGGTNAADPSTANLFLLLEERV